MMSLFMKKIKAIFYNNYFVLSYNDSLKYIKGLFNLRIMDKRVLVAYLKKYFKTGDEEIIKLIEDVVSNISFSEELKSDSGILIKKLDFEGEDFYLFFDKGSFIGFKSLFIHNDFIENNISRFAKGYFEDLVLEFQKILINYGKDNKVKKIIEYNFGDDILEKILFSIGYKAKGEFYEYKL